MVSHVQQACPNNDEGTHERNGQDSVKNNEPDSSHQKNEEGRRQGSVSHLITVGVGLLVLK